jgi:hypothetical protein
MTLSDLEALESTYPHTGLAELILSLEVMNHFLSRESQDADELRAGLLSRLPDQTISEATPFDTTPLFAAKPRGGSADRVEHRLDIKAGPADDPEHVAGAIRIASSHFIFSLMLRPSCCPTLGSIPRHYLEPRERN